jgi:CubicO group peptidase (beta-lactamase class C family)
MKPPRFGRPTRALFALLSLALVTLPLRLPADTVDDTVAALMAKRKIRGLSLAIIENGAIVKAKGYGAIDSTGSVPVTVDTLFQAGSISKPVAALGALSLVQKGTLSLDADVNASLKTWRVPENAFTATQKVTVRRLLSHSAGLTVHGFPGYAVDALKPTLVQVLDGAKPANTPAIRVDLEPGNKWRYSGGGYTVLQQLVIDVTEKEFPAFMHAAVLEPLGMSSSSFEQPLPAEKAARTATGYYTGQREVPGRWHIYPEMAAAGLWTTPSDLARFAIAVQDALAGRATSIISSELARDMLTRQKGNFGLGVGLAGKGHTERFEHGGRDDGFDASMTAYVETRQGAVIMINANDNTGTLGKVMEAIADAYRWPDYPRNVPPKPIEDKEPEVTALLKKIFDQAKAGAIDRALYTPQLADAIASSLAAETGPRADLNSFGALKDVALVGREDRDGQRRYRYRFIYENETVLVRCAYNAEGKIAGLSFQPE